MMSGVRPNATRDRANYARDCEIGRAAELLASLPEHLGETFRPRVVMLADEIMHAVQRTVPEYAGPLDGPFGAVITYGVRHAITHAVDTVGRPVILRQPWIKGFQHLGKVEFNEGRPIDCLLRAYRVGGRVAWRHVVDHGRSLGLAPDVLQVAGEAIFAYVEELSALSVQGYADARARAARAADG